MFSTLSEAWNDDPIKHVTNKIKSINKKPLSSDNISLTSNISTIGDISVNTDDIDTKNIPFLSSEFGFDSTLDHGKYAGINFNKPAIKKRNINQFNYLFDNNFDEIKKMVDQRVDLRLDEMLIDAKFKQLNNSINDKQINNQQQLVPRNWESIILIFLVVAVIVIIIILIINALKK